MLLDLPVESSLLLNINLRPNDDEIKCILHESIAVIFFLSSI